MKVDIMIGVLGSNGFLGRVLVRYFSERGSVMTLSHQANAEIHFDLRNPDFDGLKPALSQLSHLCICSSLANIDECKRLPEESYAFNVTQTCRLLEQLKAHQVIPVFFSTDLVFEGTRASYSEDDERCPTTEYGKQKKLVEDFILEQFETFLIIRMSKLYSISKEDTSPISGTLRALKSGEPIRAAVDQKITPTWVEDVPRVLEGLIQKSLFGVYHFAASQSFTRYELAQELAQWLSCSKPKIEACSIDDFSFVEPRPKDNTLCVDKVSSFLPNAFHSLAHTLNKYLACADNNH